MNKVQMNVEQLKDYLSGINSPKFFGMESVVEKKMNDYLDFWLNIDGKRKKNPNPTRNPFLPDGIFSRTRSFRMVTGFDYVESVGKRREDIGLTPEFQNEDDKEIWYNHISKSLVVHKDDPTKFYMSYQRSKNSLLSQTYLYQGNVIEKTLFESYLTKKGEHYTNQGLGENPLRVEVVKLENIKRLNIDGKRITMI
jgi:hypothetical protein